jgi:Kef-type K+ transport system membrane component KefB/nucleotide-binding universal stress UspA family protein
MINVTLALAIFLCVGFIAAKLGQLIRLPSVTGYICAGLLLGPSGFNIINEANVLDKLDHFTDIALILIAFGIGEHLELKALKRSAKSVAYIGIGETFGAFLFVSAGVFIVANATGVGDPAWNMTHYLVLSLLLGAISVATAPAATLHVMRELKAVGPLTTTLMAVVAVDDGLAIMIFGIAVSAVSHVIGSGAESMGMAVISSLTEITFSLTMGIASGLIIDYVIHHLKRRAEILAIGLALLLLCSEISRLLDLSPLLAGMAAGFTIVNRDRRDVRLFRVINDFESPIYVLFFTLAGSHLELSALVVAGWVCLVYFLLRSLGKIIGCNIGARLAHAPSTVTHFLGLALIPQAGVAIGLIFIVRGDPILAAYSSVITPVVLGSVVLSELAGPICARIAVEKAGEVTSMKDLPKVSIGPMSSEDNIVVKMDSIRLVPWTWGDLSQTHPPQGSVLFGVSHSGSGPGLARMATLFAHHYRACPLAVSVVKSEKDHQDISSDEETRSLLEKIETETKSMGYTLDTKTICNDSVANGILSLARDRMARAIVLGHPLEFSMSEFRHVVERVAQEAPCQVIVVRFAGVLHTERILVPLVYSDDLNTLAEVIRALSCVGEHTITLLTTVNSDAFEEDLEEAEEILRQWVENEDLSLSVRYRAVATESRLEAIIEEAFTHDLIVMTATQTRGLRRLFFGSIAEEVARHCQKPMLIVYGGIDLSSSPKEMPDSSL